MRPTGSTSYPGDMPRLQADADKTRWVPVTDSLGFAGRRHRKAAIRMLLGQANRALGAQERPGGGAAASGNGFAAWAMSQAAPFLMRRAAGRVLVWVWKADPELLVVMAQVQEATAQLRAARASMPMEYDDTERRDMAFEELTQRHAAVWSSAPFENVAENISDMHAALEERLAPR